MFWRQHARGLWLFAHHQDQALVAKNGQVHLPSGKHTRSISPARTPANWHARQLKHTRSALRTRLPNEQRTRSSPRTQNCARACRMAHTHTASHLQSAEPVMQNGALSRALNNIEPYQMLSMHPDAGHVAPATKPASHLRSTAPVTQNWALGCAIDNIQSFTRCRKCCACHKICKPFPRYPDTGNAVPATKFASHLQSAAPVTQNLAPAAHL